MTIDEAIKEFDNYNSATFETRFVTFSEALQLGFEALKRERENRQGTFSIPLPGETN